MRRILGAGLLCLVAGAASAQTLGGPPAPLGAGTALNSNAMGQTLSPPAQPPIGPGPWTAIQQQPNRGNGYAVPAQRAPTVQPVGPAPPFNSYKPFGDDD